MESEARRTGRAHEHELCPESARSAWQHRPAEHSRRAVSTCSRADYEKSDKQCHDAFVLQNRLAELVSPIVRQALRLPCGNRSGCPTNERIGALTQPPLLRAVFSACRESLDLANTAEHMLASPSRVRIFLARLFTLERDASPKCVASRSAATTLQESTQH